jgi:hypothetical protein
MLTPKLKISNLIEVERERTLPVPGEVLVSVGSSVGENDVVLRASLKGEIVIIKIREILSLGTEDLTDYFLVKEGELVSEGQVVFRRPGLFGFFSEEIKSAVHGEVEFVDPKSGFLGVRPKPRVFEVKAYLRGVVKSIDGSKGLAIFSSASGLLQGVYGKGRECMGLLKYVSEISSFIGSSTIDEQNTILAFPCHLNTEQLVSIARSGAKGIVVSSVPSSLIYLDFAKMGIRDDFVLMVVDGFGTIKPSTKLVQFLDNADGKPCSLSGQVQVRAGAIRPELIIHEPLRQGEVEKDDMEEDLTEGAQVRVVRGSRIGEVGVLRSFTKSQVEFPSGIRCLGVGVELDGVILQIPLQNIESL